MNISGGDAACDTVLSARVLAVDTHLLLAMDVRRFLCAMQELSGGVLVVTEKPMEEALHRCSDTSLNAAQHLAKHRIATGQVDSDRYQEISEHQAARNMLGWQRWARAESGRNDAAWQQEQSFPDTFALRNQLLMRSSAFKPQASRPHDAIVIAEGILSGADAIASHNFTSIEHGLLNEWLAGQKQQGNPFMRGVTPPFILKPDYAVQRRLTETGAVHFNREICRWAAGACMPKDTSNITLFGKVLRRFIQNIGKGGLPITSKRSLSFLDDLQKFHPDAWADRLDAQRAQRTQWAEDRRLAEVDAVDDELSP